MSDSYLNMINLESRMLSALCTDYSGSSSANSASSSGVSFSDMLDSAIGTGASSNAGGMKVSDNMVRFIEEHEGFSSTPYRGVDSWNRTTGYGHVIEGGENIGPLTQSSAENLLKNDLESCEASVNREFNGMKLSQNQFDALVSFAYNCGTNIWSKTPKLVSDIKSGASDDTIKSDLLNCSKCGGVVLKGLENRRFDEWQVYARGQYSL